VRRVVPIVLLVMLAACGAPPSVPTAKVVAGGGPSNGMHAPGAVDPFRGTPAEKFAVGEAGIVVPPTPVVAGATPQQVAGALATVRQVLVASYVDDRLLVHHDPTAVVALFAPDDRDVVRTDIARGTNGTVFVQFGPGATLAAPPRLDGDLSVSFAEVDGVPDVVVVSNYVVAYAFEGAGSLVLVRSQTHWLFARPSVVTPGSTGMFLGDDTGFWQGMDCTASGRGLTEPAPIVDPNGKPFVVDTRSPDSYYDPAAPPTATDSCIATPASPPTTR
jgi:hypothetical protein